MGAGRFDSNDWNSYAASRNYASASAEQIYTQRHIAPELDPRGVAVRESRDSADNPASTPLIVALDVTGSMGTVLAAMAKEGLNRLMTEVYARRPVTDPHVMAMGIGDAEAGDEAPLQVTQFEADLRIAQQLERVWLEKGGGGNHYESYALAWYFAARHTATDSFERRGRKGFLFTVGDERPTPYVRAVDIERVLGYRPTTAPLATGPHFRVSAADLLAEVSQRWEVYHVIVAEGAEALAHPDVVREEWRGLLGQRALWLSDHRRLAEVVVSALQLAAGHSYDEVQASWDAGTAAVVAGAIDRGISLGGMPA